MTELSLLWSFFKIGLFTFGGGYAMLPLIRQEVMAHGWMTAEEIIDFIAISESTPGPLAVNMATAVGMNTAGITGAAFATLGVVLPSFLVILLVARFYDRFRRSRLTEGAMTGLRPAVIGLIGAALLTTGRDVFFPGGFVLTPALAVSAGIFLVTAVLAFRKAHPILLIALSAVIGIGAGYALGL